MEGHGILYNTEDELMNISEYGRSVQKMVEAISKVNDRIERTKLAEGIIQVMISLNPQIKELDNYEHKLWDHLYMISDFGLDVDGPYPPPEKESVGQKPHAIPYKDELIKFRFYGRNLQQMVEQAASMEDSEMKTALVNYIASFMVNSSRNWNDENLNNSTVVEHLKVLSKGELLMPVEELDIHIEHRAKKSKPNNSQNKKKKKRRI
jgi:hypothetical protein